MAFNGSMPSSQSSAKSQLFSGVKSGPLEGYSELLLDEISDVDVRGERGKTLLHIAAQLGKLDWVVKLLEKGSDPEVEDSFGKSALHIAAQMACQFPENKIRQEILNLVILQMHKKLKK